MNPNIAAQIRAHAKAINACNQRGGRMLSLVDLVEAGTVSRPLAAYLAATMRQGASLLVGARPGGAGKTAVMCALLNFLPDSAAIRAVEGRAVLEAALRDAHLGETCYLAHEIGSGYYYAYIWGEAARIFIELAARGHTVASNLHADTLQETRQQLCDQNSVDPAHLAAIALKVYLRVRRGRGGRVQRRVSHVYESDGSEDRLLWTGDDDGTFQRHGESAWVTPVQERAQADFLAELQEQGVRRIEDVRRAVVAGARTS